MSVNSLLSYNSDDERFCWNIYNKYVKSFLKFVPNNDLKGLCRLNAEGVKKYPILKDEIFYQEQLFDFVGETGCIPFDFAVAEILNRKNKLAGNRHYNG